MPPNGPLGNTELDDAELAELGAFLGAPDAPDDRMPLVACEGFLAGVVSSPDVVMPSRWLPMVYGGGVVFDDAAQASRILALLMRFSNHIADRLHRTNDFEPSIGDERGELSVGAAVVWAHGYFDAIRLQAVRWNELIDSDVATILEPLATLARATDPQAADTPEVRRAAHDLADSVADIYDFWLQRRSRPLRRTAPKVGRNEACPCGSGRKAKRCCGSRA